MNVFYQCHAIVLSMAFLLGGCDNTETAKDEKALPEVTVLQVKAQPVMITRDLQGRTAAPEIAEVRPQVNGIVEKKLFNEGTMVTAGQPLFQLETDVYKSELAQNIANLEVAQSVATAAKLQRDRARLIIKDKYISQQDYDNIEAEYQQAVANVKASRALVDNARINLRYTTIVAPISGQVGRSNITVGALLTANQTDSLVTIQKIDPMYLDITQSGEDFIQLRREVDQGRLSPVPVTVHMFLKDGKEYEQSGVLQFADATMGESTGTVSLRAEFPNDKHYLLPGMFVRARVDVARRESAVLVPQNLIIRAVTGEASVFAVSAENKLVSLPVTLGRTIGNQFLVEEGLVGGENLVVEGSKNLAAGTAVQIVANKNEG